MKLKALSLVALFLIAGAGLSTANDQITSSPTAPFNANGESAPELSAVARFVNAPGYCAIYVGQNQELDAVTADYSKAAAALIPEDANMTDVADLHAQVKAACNRKLAANGPGFF